MALPIVRRLVGNVLVSQWHRLDFGARRDSARPLQSNA
jgi:hypothetical protein